MKDLGDGESISIYTEGDSRASRKSFGVYSDSDGLNYVDI